METPSVSIILPNYNHGRFLKQRLESIFQQSYQDFELILLDDASTDESQKTLKRYKDHPKVTHILLNSVNSGSTFKQWQKGINLAKGKFIWIAESDDYSELTFLEHLLIKMNDKIGICYSQTIDLDENGKTLLNRIEYTKEFNPNIWKNNFVVLGHEFIAKYLLIKNVIPNASAVIFKRDLIDADFFSNNLLQMKMCGDWFFWIKLCEKTEISFISEPLNYFRNHNAISRKHNTAKKKKRRLWEESEIRYYTFKKLNIFNQTKNKELIKNWFKLHSLQSIFSGAFYKIHLPFTNNFSLFLIFLKYKLKK